MPTRLDAITTGYSLATAKTALPTVGSVKRNLLNAFAIKFYRDWQNETGVEWESLSRIVSAGTVTTTAVQYDLAEDINYISKDENNNVLINDQKFLVVSVSQLTKYKYSNAVAHVRVDNVSSLRFSQAFITGSSLIGKTIEVPCVIKLDDLTSDTSEILIDQPEWLGERIAAQYAFSFKSTRDMYDDLLQMANDRMNSMKMNNNTGQESYNTGIDYFAVNGNGGSDY